MNRIKVLLKHDTAGDPMTGLKWSRKTPQKIANELGKAGIEVSAKTVARLMKKMGFSLRVNRKRIESGSKNPPKRKDRNSQFEYIAKMRESFAENGNPVISVDAKKKEPVGNFKNEGTSWEEESVDVNDHDFRSDATGIAVPYGVYVTKKNTGYVFVGMSAETPAFAVDCIKSWWNIEGRKVYPNATEILILADCGGANAVRSKAFKYRIQKHICDAHNLTVTVCHYPPGASKYNPVEHRLFSEISKNWRGVPLRTFQTILNYIRTTRTQTKPGLTVKARLVRRKYEKGENIPREKMKEISLSRHETLPAWNYTISPTEW